MNITAVLGSPRENGITSTISNAFIDTAASLGAQTSTYVLNKMHFKGCQGCQACKTKKNHCVLKDDLTNVFEDIKTADIIVFSTPVYFWDVTGQFKCFFDRTWSLVKPDYMTNPDPVRLERGKTAIFISSQGDVEEKHKDLVEKYTGFLAMFGAKVHTIRAFGMNDRPGTDITPFTDKARQLAVQLLS